MLSILCVLLLAVVTARGLPLDCQQDGYRLTCQYSLPPVLPSNTTEVYVLLQNRKSGSQWYTEETFSDPSWRTVTKLNINTSDINFDVGLENNVFMNLKSLRYLGYHDPALGSVSKRTFVGLTVLSTLDLADCFNLKGSTVVEALSENDTVRYLDTLVLDNIQTRYETGSFLGEPFWNVIHEKKVKTLSLSGTSSEISVSHIEGKLSALQSLNLSHSRISFDRPQAFQLLQAIQNLRSVDMSYVYIGKQRSDNVVDQNITVCEGVPSLFLRLINTFEKLYTSGVFKEATIIDRSYIDYSSCEFHLQVFHTADNNIKKLNGTIKFPSNASLYEIDLSKNGLTYLSPEAFLSVPIKNLFLSSNELHQMEPYPEFANLLKNYPLLENLTLADNNFKTIPEQMFRNNIHLRVLDLSENLLELVTFETRYLKELVALDLSRNKISVLDSASITRLDQLWGMSDTHSVYINIENNTFTCSCASMKSIKWLISFQKKTSKQKLHCNLNEQIIHIDERALENSKSICPRTLLILMSTGSGILVCGLIILFFLHIRHRRRLDKLRSAKSLFTEHFRLGSVGAKFIAMLSFSSEEKREKIEYIHRTLESHLKDKLGVNRDTVCIDYKHFRLGYPVVSEMINAVDKSAVMVFVVSKSFCRHQWCITEFEEALSQKKPMILLYTEHVDVNAMPDPLRKVHDRYTRAKLLETADGSFELVPSASLAAESIIELASVASVNTMTTTETLSKNYI